jgi:enoyl-CoA hydratase
MMRRGTLMLKIACQGNSIVLTLNNPEKGNALSREMVEALIEQTTLAYANQEIHALVLNAEGPHFCTGLDLSNLDNESDGDLLHRLVRIETFLAMLWSAPITTTALVKGRTWGAGADLLVACEHRIAHTNTTFRFPGAQFGIVLGTARLADRTGVDQARLLILQGKEIDAETAFGMGLTTALGTVYSQAEAVVSRKAALAIRAASRNDLRADHDLAALVRSAAIPGLKQRIIDYRNKLKKS